MERFAIRNRFVRHETAKNGGLKEIFELAIDIEKDVVIDKETYSNKITIGITDTHGKLADWSEVITVISSNKQTGVQVDAQRKKEINHCIKSLNS